MMEAFKKHFDKLQAQFWHVNITLKREQTVPAEMGSRITTAKSVLAPLRPANNAWSVPTRICPFTMFNNGQAPIFTAPV